MSNEIIERVAAALRQVMASLSNPEADALARAAIEAMREPTDDMVEAGRWPAEDDGPLACWQEMIDIALTELSPPRPAGSADRYGVPRAEE